MRFPAYGNSIGCSSPPTEGGGQPVPGQAPYTAQRAPFTGNLERDPMGNITTRGCVGEVEQFRDGDLSQGLAFRQPL